MSLKRPETRSVTSTLGLSSNAKGNISIPETRSVPSTQIGLAPSKWRAIENSSPPVLIVAEPHKSIIVLFGHSPFSCK